MNGDQAILFFELAIRRVHDRMRSQLPHTVDSLRMLEALNGIATEIASMDAERRKHCKEC